jgi:hypothetical protein
LGRLEHVEELIAPVLDARRALELASQESRPFRQSLLIQTVFPSTSFHTEFPGRGC